jgi:methionine-rich copper-binding protein CopC
MTRRLALATVVLSAPLALGTAAASAHTEVARTSPGSGKTATTSTRAVLVTFTGQIRRGTLRVVGPDRRVVSVGSGGVDPRNVKRLRVGLQRGLKAGRYAARWTIVAADGHAQKGTFSFRLKRR